MLIHDENFDKFNSRNFNSRFNVHQFGVSSFEDLEKRKKELNEEMRRLRPEGIYIHLGANDLVKRKCIPSGSIHELAEFLLKNSMAQICFSLLIPSSNNETFNERIHLTNNEMKSNVSWFHRNDESARSRLFTFSNDKVGNQNTYSVNTGFELKEWGEKLLYLRLREGLRKTMRMPRPSYHNNRQQKRSSNRFSDE